MINKQSQPEIDSEQVVNLKMSENVNLKKSYLFILPWSLTSLGGVNQVVENLYNKISLDNKYNPIVMVNSWNDFKIRKKNIKKIDHYFFRIRSPWSTSNKTYNFIWFCLELHRTLLRLHGFIKINNIVVINVHYCSLFAVNIALLKLLKLFKGCFILSFHGKDLLGAKQSSGIERKLWKFILNKTDKIVTCSEALRNELLEFDESCSDKLEAIHNGFDLSLPPDNLCRHLDSNLKNEKYILNVATLEHKKGQDVLLKAFGVIAGDFPDVSLVIIGRPGGAENQIKGLIQSLKLSQRVRLYEGLPHDQVLSFMERAMIFVLPSRYEPFGIVILESGAFGVPVVASNVGGVGEILSHNENGRLFDSENINCLAEELSRLLIDSEERTRLGGNLRTHVIDNFSWKRTYQKYLDIVGP